MPTRWRAAYVGCILLATAEGKTHSSNSTGSAVTLVASYARLNAVELHNVSHHSARQIDPSVPTSSSYDYWWPYPAGGATTSTVAPFPASNTPIAVSTTLPSGGITTVLPSSISSYQSVVLANSTLSSSAISTPSITSPSNITTITALPPSSTPASHPHKHIEVNPLYLLPVFALLGISMGSLFIWGISRCCCKRAKGEEDCVSGPRYMPAQGDEAQAEDAEAERERNEKAQWMSREQSRSQNTDSDGARTPFSWPSVTPTPRGYEYERGRPFDRDHDEELQGEAQQPVPSHVDDADPVVLPTQADTPYSLSLLSPEDTQEMQVNVSYDSMRQKSIRRSLLSRIIGGGSIHRTRSGKATVKEVKTGRGKVPNTPELEEGWSLVRSPEYGEVESPLRRARTEQAKDPRHAGDKGQRSVSMRYAHKRADSDFTVDMMKTPSRMDRLTTGGNTSAIDESPSQERDPTVWVPGGGFRIVQEDPEGWEDVPLQATAETPAAKDGENEGQGSWISLKNIALEVSKTLALAATPSRASSSSSREERDHYSPIPVRTKRERMASPVSRTASLLSSPQTPRSRAASPSPSRRTPHRTPTRNGKRTLARVDSVLPPTPAVLMSPPLESKLFFSSPVCSPSSQGAMTSRAYTAHCNSSSPTHTPTRKLQTTKKAPLLPFPSTEGGSPYRGRLTKTPTKPAKVLSPTGHSPPALRRPTSPVERYKARHGALHKVEEILSRSWSEREVSGGIPQSPTMFGAIHSVGGGEQRGIEQMLLS